MVTPRSAKEGPKLVLVGITSPAAFTLKENPPDDDGQRKRGQLGRERDVHLARGQLQAFADDEVRLMVDRSGRRISRIRGDGVDCGGVEQPLDHSREGLSRRSVRKKSIPQALSTYKRKRRMCLLLCCDTIRGGLSVVQHREPRSCRKCDMELGFYTDAFD